MLNTPNKDELKAPLYNVVAASIYIQQNVMQTQIPSTYQALR